MKVIFESIFSGFMKPFDKDVQRLVGAIPACYEGAFDSWPSHDAGGGFFVDFELFRTASGPSRRVREVASMASSRDSAFMKPSS